jgi:hypothetical protein
MPMSLGSGDFKVDQKLFCLSPYYNVRGTAQKISLFMTQEVGIALFEATTTAHINGNSALTAIDKQQHNSALAITYGMRLGGGYEIIRNLQIEGTGGFFFDFIPMNATIPKLSSNGSLVMNQTECFYGTFFLNLRLNYKLK